MAHMATDGDVDTSRARIQTYVPAYQRSKWQDHAEELDMSLSEFVRSMVQAGRRGFNGSGGSACENQVKKSGADHNSDADPRGKRLEDRVLSIIDDNACYDWDELLNAMTENVEAQLEEALDELQARDEIKYSGREGGYVRK